MRNQSNRILSDSDKSLLQNFFHEVKVLIFNYASNILKENNVNKYLRTIFIVAETLQTINFCFRDSIQVLWGSGKFTDGLVKILNYLYFTPYFKDLSYETYMVFQYILAVGTCNCAISVGIILYQIKSRGFANEFILTFVRIAGEIVASILYIPILDYFLSVFQCYEKDGILIHRYYTGLTCFTINHLPGMLLGIIFSLIQIIYFCFETQIIFECRYESNDCSHRSTSKQEFYLFLYKTFMPIYFTVVQSCKYKLVYVLPIFLLSYSLFLKFRINLTHYDFLMAKLATIQVSTIGWSGIMLLFAYFQGYSIYDHTIYIFVIGFIVIVVGQLIKKDIEYSIALINHTCYQGQQEALLQIPYLTKLIQMYHFDKSVQLLLDGYIVYHSTICTEPLCPSKFRVAKTNNFSKQLRIEGESEQVIILINIVQTLYLKALKHFPNNTRFRILYAIFLIDIFKSKQQSLQELQNCENEKPNFEEQFIIHRYKAIIETQLTDNSTKSQEQHSKGILKSVSGSEGASQDMMNELTIQSHIDSCIQNITQSAQLHGEFWIMLKDDHPDLNKLAELGFKISFYSQESDLQYERLVKMNALVPSIVMIYARFHSEILNDQYKSESILNQLTQLIQNKSQTSLFMDLTLESRPTIVISAEEDSYGVITNINMGASAILGYHRNDVISKNISIIMPKIYREFHNDFIHNYLDNFESRIIGTDSFQPALNKMGYLELVYIYIRHVPSLVHGIQFIATLKQEKTLKKQCFLLINNDGQVDCISSSCINLLHLENKRVKQQSIVITDLVDDFYQRNEHYKKKAGVDKIIQTFYASKICKIYVNIQAKEISFRQQGQQGYLLKIVKLKYPQKKREKANCQSINQTVNSLKCIEVGLQRQLDRSNCHFEMKFEVDSDSYIGNFIQGKYTNLNDSILKDLSSYHPELSQSQGQVTISDTVIIGQKHFQMMEQVTQEMKDQQTCEKNNQRADYSQGIRCLRLVQDRLVDIDDLRYEEEEVLAELEETQKGTIQIYNSQVKYDQSNDKDSAVSLANVFRKKSNFKRFIIESGFLKVHIVHFYHLFAILCGVISLIACLLNYYVIMKSMKSSQNWFKSVSYSNQYIGYMISMLRDTINIRFAQENQIIFLDNLNQESYYLLQKAQLLKSLNEFSEIYQFLLLGTLNQSPTYKSLTQTKVVSMAFTQNGEVKSVENYTIYDATEIIVSKFNNLYSEEMSEFQNLNSDYLDNKLNIQNLFMQQLRTYADSYVTGMQKWVDSKLIIYKEMLILIIIIILISYFFEILFFCLQSSSKREVLTMFLEIPQPKINTLVHSSEQFIAQVSAGNENELVSQNRQSGNLLQQQVDEEEDQGIFAYRSKSKKYVFANKDTVSFFLPLTLCSLFLLGYFIGNYIINIQYNQQLSSAIREFNSTCYMDAYFIFSRNGMSQVLYDDTVTLKGQDSYTYLIGSVDSMYQINAFVEEEHSKNLKHHTHKYLNAFNSIMMSNACKVINELGVQDIDDCEEYQNGIVKEGFSTIFQHYFDLFKQLLIEFNQIKIQYNNERDVYKYETRKLLNQTDFYEISTLQDKYISNAIYYLQDQFIQGQKETFDNTNSLKLTLLICIILVIFLVYFMFWQPILSTTQKEIIKIRSMILMIPLDVCQGLKNIREVVSSYFKDNEKVNNQSKQHQ